MTTWNNPVASSNHAQTFNTATSDTGRLASGMRACPAGYFHGCLQQKNEADGVRGKGKEGSAGIHIRAFRGSGRFQNLADRVGSGQAVFAISPVGSVRVGSEGFKCHGSGRVR